jgi:hypothetical protein
MAYATRTLLTAALMMSLSAPGFAAQKESGGPPEAQHRDIKNSIYALAAEAEDLKAGKSPSAPSVGAGRSQRMTGNPSPEMEPGENQQGIIKMPDENKSTLQNFVGSWYFKDVLRGEELTIEAFEISKNASGDFILAPPKRAADSYASVTQFEINDRNLKLQLRWKMKSVVGYWKTETYDLILSKDGRTLTGSHNQKSVGGGTIYMDRVLFRR